MLVTHQPRVRIIPVIKAKPRRPLEALGAAAFLLAALPAGLILNLFLYHLYYASALNDQPTAVSPADADRIGFATTALFGAAAAIFGWHARRRIRRKPGILRGVTTSTIALYGGVFILIACGVVLLKMLLE